MAPSLPEVAAGFREAGVLDGEHPDVAVLTATDPPPLAGEAPMAVCLGRGGRRMLAPVAPVVRRFVTVPGVRRPHLVVPVDRPRVAGYAIRTWSTPLSQVRRARNELGRLAVATGALPDLERSLTVGLPAAGPPFLLAAAVPLGVEPASDWFLTLGAGDALARATFQVFPPGEPAPRWVVKFSRVAGHIDPFEREERGLALAARAGAATAAHAPRLLGRFEAAGLPASVESAAVGERVVNALRRRGRRSEKLALIDAIARWILDVARESRADAGALDAERRRLAAEVLPRWQGQGIPADLADRLPPIPAVLQHNDLGCWNIIAGRGTFVAVDWESARRHGLPLWDLVYFLVDALVHLQGDQSPAERDAYAIRLLRGETPDSPVLARWVRTAVDELAIDPDAVAAIVTLCWLHHGLSSVTRNAAAAALAPGLEAAETYTDRMVRLWLSSPGLGLDWRGWLG